jgi:hypothetical protein
MFGLGSTSDEGYGCPPNLSDDPGLPVIYDPCLTARLYIVSSLPKQLSISLRIHHLSALSTASIRIGLQALEPLVALVALAGSFALPGVPAAF